MSGGCGGLVGGNNRREHEAVKSHSMNCVVDIDSQELELVE